ncbi:MAG: cytochrome c biogenesis protein CcdA [bacterium]|nr:cytochrome c biogenesis protein CcdA [bacterium]
MGEMLFQTSLVAAFIAGVVALFAPCCITFLLPAYLGSVFKEKEKVVLMTLVFGAGIFTVLLPAVLGIAFISQSLFRYHDVIYPVGGWVMLAVATITFLGVKLPMPHLTRKGKQKTDVLSIFTLGIFSGITSACCAPVLIGILTLTFLSPSFFGALTIGAFYVLGMVVPLLLISLLLDGKVKNFFILRKPITSLSFLGKTYLITLSNLIASTIFFATGILILYLAKMGKLSAENMEGFTKMITGSAETIDSLVGKNVLVDIILVVGLIYLLGKVVKKV